MSRFIVIPDHDDDCDDKIEQRTRCVVSSYAEVSYKAFCSFAMLDYDNSCNYSDCNFKDTASVGAERVFLRLLILLYS